MRSGGFPGLLLPRVDKHCGVVPATTHAKRGANSKLNANARQRAPLTHTVHQFYALQKSSS
jgi:hypothetical protein